MDTHLRHLIFTSLLPVAVLFVGGCGSPPPPEWPYGKPGSRTATIPEAGQVFKAAFSAFDEKDFLLAEQRGDFDNPSGMQVDAKKGEISFRICLFTNEGKYRKWAEETKKSLGPLSTGYKKVKRNGKMKGSAICIDGWRFEMPKSWAPIMEASLQVVPPKRFVRICLADKDGFTIAEKTVPSSLFGQDTLKDFCTGEPAFQTIKFPNLSYTQITRAAKALCQVGTQESFALAFAETANAYRKAHPAYKLRLPGGIALEIENLTPYFGIGKYEVTQAQWESVMGKNPSWKIGSNRPVENVSWDDCAEFIEKMNALPEIRAAGIRVRFPTIDEWCVACRAGSSGSYGKLADGTERQMEEMGWYAANSGETTHDVGLKTPNAFGLYDMHGNVSELCEDASLFHRYCLGGSYKDDAGNCKADSRNRHTSGGRSGSVGLRLAASSID